MKILSMFFIALLVVVFVFDKKQQETINTNLTNFIGKPAVSTWTETMSNGESRHYTRWSNCTAVIGEYNKSYFYITKPHCNYKESI